MSEREPEPGCKDYHDVYRTKRDDHKPICGVTYHSSCNRCMTILEAPSIAELDTLMKEQHTDCKYGGF